MALEREVNLHFDEIDFIRSVFLSLFRSISFDGKILGGKGERTQKGREGNPLSWLSWKLINEEDGINRALISFCLKKGEKEEKEEEEFWEDCNGFRRWDEEDSLCVWTTGRKLGARLEDCFIGHFIKLGTVA